MNTELAIFGGKPTFEPPVQPRHLIPDWGQFEKLIDGIFDRRYYTNHGPLALEFEKKFKEFFGVRNALYMTNSGIALMITTNALGLRGNVILPAFSHVSVAQAVIWAGAQPVYCDVNRETMHLDVEMLESLIDGNTSAILGVNLFGGSCEYARIEEIAARHSIPSYYLSDDAIGEQYRNKKIGNFGKLEVFSLHESKIINAVNGCIVTCNDDLLAEKIRHIRSSYGLGKPTQVAFTGNGRMSEIVAGMALFGLEQYELHVNENKRVFEAFEKIINKVEGLYVYQPGSSISDRNYHRLIVRVDEAKFGLSAGELCKVIQAENFPVARLNHYSQNAMPPYNTLTTHPNSSHLAAGLLELPMDKSILSNERSDKFLSILISASGNSKLIKTQLQN